MATNQAIQLRLTHRYQPGWAELDNWQYIGTVKLLPPKRLRGGNGYDEVGRYHQLAVVPRSVPTSVAIRALVQTLTEEHTSRCSHDYDCCGCHFATVRVKHRRGKTFSVITDHMRNF